MLRALVLAAMFCAGSGAAAAFASAAHHTLRRAGRAGRVGRVGRGSALCAAIKKVTGEELEIEMMDWDKVSVCAAH